MDVPVLATQICKQVIVEFRIVAEGTGKLGRDASFLGVPAEHGDKVDRCTPQVVELWINGLEWQAAKEEKQTFFVVVAPTVSLPITESDIEGAVFASEQVVTVNTAAAGGNATLLSEGDE